MYNIKKLALFALAVGMVVGLSGCEDKKSIKLSDANITEQQKNSYAIGASLAYQVKDQGDQGNEILGKFDNDIITQAFVEVMGDKGQMDREAVEASLTTMTQKIMESRQQEYQALAKTNLDEAQTFMTDNAKKEGVQSTMSGLQYKVIAQGTGDNAKLGDKVLVSYKGSLTDGRVFDQSQSPVEFDLIEGQLIQGFIEGIVLMNAGSHYELYLPPQLGYGERSPNPNVIPPNAALIFDVTLESITAKQ